MKKAILYSLLAVLIIFAPTTGARAESDAINTARILIVELQTGGSQDATAEFIELYNPSNTTIDITGWQLQYRSSSYTAQQAWPSSSTKATIACVSSAPNCTVSIAAQERLVLAHNMPTLNDAIPMTGGFSDKGGEIRLIQPGATPVVHDFIGYGVAADAEGSPAPAPAAGKSVKRKLLDAHLFSDTNNNFADFAADCGDPSPGTTDSSFILFTTGCAAIPVSQTSEPPTGNNPPDGTQQTDQTPPDTNPSVNSDLPGRGAAALLLLITEVLPDPASPQQDDTDEFIELYNPNDTDVILTGYQLQAGASYRYHFTLGDTLLKAHDYVAIPSAISNVSLSNNGSSVRLLGPDGSVMQEVQNYGTAKEGESWILDDTGWHWTLTPTPGVANILTVPAPKPVAIPATTMTNKKKVTKAASTKVSAPKLPKAPAAKKSTKQEQSKSALSQAAVTPQNPQLWLLAPIGALTAGYVAYEYRRDIGRLARNGWAAATRRKSDDKTLDIKSRYCKK